MAAKKQGKARVQRDICQEITDRIVDLLEQGVVPWSPEQDTTGVPVIPSNASSGNVFHGVNVINLWVEQHRRGFSSPLWMSFKQAKEAGGSVRKGEKGSRVIFYKTLEKETDQTDDNGEAVTETVPMLKSSTLFNLDQIENVDHLRDVERPRYDFTPVEIGEHLIDASGVPLSHGGVTPFYRPSDDSITMPERDRFPVSEDYYAVYAHELVHATKHRDRCDRKPYETDVRRGAYAFEEMVAEQGALFVCAHLGLPRQLDNHAAYIDGWLSVLKADKRAIFKAAAQAQKATDWILQRLDTHLQQTAAA